ncbi:hypothetical protein ACFQZZ_25950 [Nocardia sp. GCM10030253]
MAEPLPIVAGPMAPDIRFDIGPVRYPKLHWDTTVPIPMSDGGDPDR